MYQKRNRIYDRLAADKASGKSERISREFVTTTLREGAFTQEQSFTLVKLGMAYAIQMVRRKRKYNKRYRRSAWSGCELDYVNDVDVHPSNGRAHVHALYGVGFPGVDGRKREGMLRARLARRFCKELHYYLNNWLRKRLGLPTMRWREGESYPYVGAESVAYVHLSGAREDGSRGNERNGVRSAENVAMYMAHHNGKIWTDGREYPKRYRRFSTSRGYLPKVEKSEGPSPWTFVRDSLGAICQKLAVQGVPVGPAALADVGHDGTELSRLALADLDSYRVRWALGLVSESEEAAPALSVLSTSEEGERFYFGEQVEKMRALQAYWDSSEYAEGVSFDAWKSGALAPSLVALVEPGAAAPLPLVLELGPVLPAGEPENDIALLVADFLRLAPSLTEEQARVWVEMVARIKARKTAGLVRRRCGTASGLSRTGARGAGPAAGSL